MVRMVVIALAASAVAFAVAFFLPWFPENASVEAGRIQGVFWLATIICIAIFGLVTSVLLYSVWKFRAHPDDDSDGQPIHGHTGLEIWWTAIPAVLVTVIGVWSAVVLSQNEDATGAMRIDVTAQQFAWSFAYPEAGGVVSTDMRLPIDQPVKLVLQAKDVIHSFWVPEFSQKQDAVPGIVTELVITPTKLGTYPVICTELCGLGHATMRSEVKVVSREEFDQWVSDRRAAANEGGAANGEAIFADNGCSGCHALDDTKQVGPGLGTLDEAAERAGQPIEEFTRTSITNPSEYIEPGFPPAMPASYGGLSDEQLDALVQYLVENAK
jgi:cytochrome c oxidase subunit II